MPDLKNMIWSNRKLFYTNLANYYDIFHHIQTLWADDIHRKKVVNLLHSKNIVDCLEIGCGTGITTKLILDNYPNVKLTAIDNSMNMLKQLKQRSMRNNLLVLQCDLTNLPFNNNHFDAIFSTYCLGGIKNLRKAFIEIKRVLKVDGLFALCEMTNPSRIEFPIRYKIHKIFIEPIIFLLWGFKDIDIEKYLSVFDFNILFKKFRMDRVLGSTLILLAKNKEKIKNV